MILHFILIGFLVSCSSAFRLSSSVAPPALSRHSNINNLHFTNSPCVALRRASETALRMGVTIYGHPGTRSPLVNWACFELGLDFNMGDLSKNPHPFGQIPCLTDSDDVTVFESGAILQHLNKQYAKGLTEKQTAAIASWIAWANASLDPICFLETPEGKVYDTGLRKPNRRIDQLNSMLKKNMYLVDNFSLADVAVSSYILYVLQFFPDIDLCRWPNVVRYARDCAGRPAYGKAFGENMQSFLVEKLSSDPPQKLFGVF